jgi:hypothetical protein
MEGPQRVQCLIWRFEQAFINDRTSCHALRYFAYCFCDWIILTFQSHLKNRANIMRFLHIYISVLERICIDYFANSFVTLKQQG